MKLDIAIIQILDLIDRYGSISKAARALHKVPSGLSHAISKAERKLKVKLLKTEKKSVEISPIGRILLEDGRKVLKSIEQLEEKITHIENDLEEEIVIGVDTNMPMKPILQLIARFLQTSPKSSIALIQKDSSKLLQDLEAADIQLMIGVSLERSIQGRSINSRALAISPQWLIMALQHPMYDTITERSLSLEDYPWASLTWITLDNEDHLDYPFELRAYVGRTLSVPNREAQLNAMSMGLGIGLVPEVYCKTLEDGTFSILRHNSNWNTYFQAAWSTTKMEKSLRWFIRQFDSVYIRTALTSLNRDIAFSMTSNYFSEHKES